MTDDIRTLTARMAEEPGSLAFLELARGAPAPRAAGGRVQGGARRPVPVSGPRRRARSHGAGAERPGRPGRRIRRLGHGAAARSDADQRAQGDRVPLLPRGRHRAAALDHLQRAMEIDPDDPTIRQAFGRMAAGRTDPSPAQGAARGRRRERPIASAPRACPARRGAVPSGDRPPPHEPPASSTASMAANAVSC